MESPELVLFKSATCPFCQRVFEAIERLKLKVEFKDIEENEEYLQELVQVTKRQTVPCLFINGKPKFESDEIVKWLEAEQGQLAKKT